MNKGTISGNPVHALMWLIPDKRIETLLEKED